MHVFTKFGVHYPAQECLQLCGQHGERRGYARIRANAKDTDGYVSLYPMHIRDSDFPAQCHVLGTRLNPVSHAVAH